MTGTNRQDQHGQFGLDIDDMLREVRLERATPWMGAPLAFTTEFHTPTELDAALERVLLENGERDRSRGGRRMWRPVFWTDQRLTLGDHGLALFMADLRCEPWQIGGDHQGCSCVGDLLYQAICETCHWHQIGEENAVVEAWHDHAIPCWRDLPVVPRSLGRGDTPGLSRKQLAWIDAHYPQDAKVTGAPVITERQPMGTRHVLGRSPWGGYDISHTALGSIAAAGPNGELRARVAQLHPADRAAVRADRTPGIGD